MLKTKAMKLLGDSPTVAAKAIGVSKQAIDKWPDVLPPRIADRVQAHLYRKMMAEKKAGKSGGMRKSHDRRKNLPSPTTPDADAGA